MLGSKLFLNFKCAKNWEPVVIQGKESIPCKFRDVFLSIFLDPETYSWSEFINVLEDLIEQSLLRSEQSAALDIFRCC